MRICANDPSYHESVTQHAGVACDKQYLLVIISKLVSNNTYTDTNGKQSRVEFLLKRVIHIDASGMGETIHATYYSKETDYQVSRRKQLSHDNIKEVGISASLQRSNLQVDRIRLIATIVIFWSL